MQWNQSKAYDMQYYRTLLQKIIVVITFESPDKYILYYLSIYSFKISLYDLNLNQHLRLVRYSLYYNMQVKNSYINSEWKRFFSFHSLSHLTFLDISSQIVMF